MENKAVEYVIGIVGSEETWEVEFDEFCTTAVRCTITVASATVS